MSFANQLSQPDIRLLPEKQFVGKMMTMSFAENKTLELWRSFMPYRKQITDVVGTELFSIEQYPATFFDRFNPETLFKKWAAVEVNSYNNVPDGMESLIVSKGMYAVFLHKGPASDGPTTYRSIFQDWLPKSGYRLSERPHLAVMGEKYKHEQADSEEELWIPIEPKVF